MNNLPLHDAQVIQAMKLFHQQFHHTPETVVFAPGRCNLIGEHTDYNEGFVLPFALPYKTVIVASKAPSGQTVSTLVSGAYIHDDPVKFTINKDLGKGAPEWANYVKGTIFQYINDLPADAAIEAAIVSSVPIGSGLSSSAAIEVATATMLEALYEIKKVDKIAKALRCQKAEHTFANMPCGIMDQFISTLGEEGNLLLIDCRSNHSQLVPFGNDGNAPVILITNSNVKHELTGSEYPDRVKQCKEAVAALTKKFPPVKSLRDATHDMLEQIRSDISTTAFKRARHVIDENTRTLQTVECLKAKDFKMVGNYMTHSHYSLRDDYEVSCEEVDFLVKNALAVNGVLGSRMTGGGFGGCTVTLVEKWALKDLEEFLRESYYKQFHKRCDCYEAIPSPGATILDISNYLKFADSLSAGEEDEAIDKIHSGNGNRHGFPSLAELKDKLSLDYVIPIGVAALGIGITLSYLLSGNGSRSNKR